MTRYSGIEPLEARIAPAIVNPIFDLTASPGSNGASIDLDKLIDGSSYRTRVELVTNFTLPGQTTPGIITIELFDEKAPLTVANFLRYVNNADAAGDYDGLIFHRLVPGFVLQGGGFDPGFFTTGNHIDTFAPVHNEYDPNDPERSNLAQTVAMAKVGSENGGGPHSATSEFFINLSNNAGNLDHQNGGFTVFGRVTDDSMAVVSAIANLQRVQGSEVPVQNYSGGLPTAAQMIQIVDARVVTPQEATAPGYTFDIQSITDATTGAATKLVTGKIGADNHLNLKFAANKAGVAKVTIKATGPGGEVFTDDFLVTVKPNLISEVSDDGLASVFVAGDKGTAKIKLTNNGGGLAKGKVNIKLYLSDSTGPSAGYDIEEDADLLLTTLQNVKVNIKPGKSATVPVRFEVPDLADLGDKLADGKKYRLLVLVEGADGSVQELFVDDNKGNSHLGNDPSVLPTYDLAFGNVGGRKGISLTVENDVGQPITFNLKGPGLGTVEIGENGELKVSVTGTDATSLLTVSTPRGVQAELAELSIQDTIGHVKLPNVDLLGHFTASGGAKSIVLGNLGSSDPEFAGIDRSLSIGTFPVEKQKLSLSFGEVRDYSMLASMAVSTISARTWLNTDGSNDNEIFVQSLGALKIAGNLEARLIVATEDKVNSINVGGALRNGGIQALGDISVIKLGSIIGSTVFAGLSEVPDARADFSLESSITKFIVNGTVSNSVIAAAEFNSIQIGSVTSTADAESNGFYADAIRSYLRKSGERLSRLDDANLSDDQPTRVDVIDSGHYAVNLF